LLVQCPDCRVPFVIEETSTPTLTPDQLRMLAGQIFGSWKFWAALLIVVGGAAWIIVKVADRMIDARANAYLNTLERQATNHIGAAFGQISNQIATEFRQPRIRAAMEQVARDRALDVFTNGVQPSLEAFEEALDIAKSQLAHSSNAIAQLERDSREARSRLQAAVAAAVLAQIPPTNSYVPTNPIAVAPPVAATPTNPAPTSTPPAAISSGLKLTLINRAVTQVGNDYTLTLFFRASDPSVTGMVEVEAGIYKQTAKIVNFAAMTTGPAETAAFNETGDAARLRFNVSPREAPTLILEVSGPTIVRLSSDTFDSDLTLPIAAEKLQLPAASK
jgi:hypothetical protein